MHTWTVARNLDGQPWAVRRDDVIVMSLPGDYDGFDVLNYVEQALIFRPVQWRLLRGYRLRGFTATV